MVKTMTTRIWTTSVLLLALDSTSQTEKTLSASWEKQQCKWTVTARTTGTKCGAASLIPTLLDMGFVSSRYPSKPLGLPPSYPAGITGRMRIWSMNTQKRSMILFWVSCKITFIELVQEFQKSSKTTLVSISHTFTLLDYLIPMATGTGSNLLVSRHFK